jgi:hypothetical protein
MLDLSGMPSGVPTRAPRRLELVADTDGDVQPGTQDLFSDVDDLALTQIRVPITVAPPRDAESQRRFEEFWLAPAAAEPEAPVVYRSVFPPPPFLERPVVRGVLVGALALAAVATLIGAFMQLAG